MTQPTEFDVFVAQQRAFVDELYDGTLLSDRSQKEKENVDKLKTPDAATLERELHEIEEEEARQRFEEAERREFGYCYASVGAG